LFGGEAQENHVLQSALSTFVRIKETIRERVDVLTKAGQTIDDELAAQLRTSIIQERVFRVKGKAFAESMDEPHEQVVRDTYAKVIESAMGAVFEQLPLTPDDRTALQDCVVFTLTRQEFGSGTGGVVIAGFGTAEHFPALHSSLVQARVAGKLKYFHHEPSIISAEMGAEIVPFAQTDAVRLFIEGIDPSHASLATRLVAESMEGLASDILGAIGLDEEERSKALEKIKDLPSKHWRDFSERAKAARQEKYVNPLVDIIETLPKDELASVAEALVNITSLRRKVSMDAETVGGPIDVAVISKGDGLVWIQRKHYFKPGLNPQFFENYFRGQQVEVNDGQ
jgi:hypothetical protein